PPRFFFSSRRRHTRFSRDWSSDVCSSDLLSEGAQIMGAPVQAGVRSSDAANSDNGLTPQARTRNAVVRTRSLSGRFFVLPPSSFWLGELEPAPLAPPALVIRIVDAPAHPQP